MASPLGLNFPRDEKERKIPQYRVVENKAVKSLFNGGQLSPYPTQANKASGSVEKINNAYSIHNDDSNDISIESIIQYTAQHSAMKLNYAHFAYLKNLGVYPNNRLIIARRFAGGVANDLTTLNGSSPISTLVSWFSDQEDTFSIKFNEDWTDAEGGFEEVLNDIGEDVLGGDNKGGKLGTANKGAFGIIPLPGLMQGVQLELFKKLGISGEGQGAGMSPFGNPNLIREAKRRSTLSNDGKAGSGLKCDFQIKMIIEYEQKFINGVDPTIVYLDILQNALTFGTSESVFQYSSAFGAGTNDIIKKLISGDINGIIQSLTQMISKLIEVIREQITKVVNGLISALDKKKEDKNKSSEEKEAARDAEERGLITGAAEALLGNLLKISLGTVISKYKVRLLGITNALTGGASTPWHVTIGNPKKPIFSSGDLLCEGVTVTLGKVLAFNDLPSSIKLEVTFKNARGLGAQEIFNRFNTGRGRSYTRINKSFVEVNDSIIDENVKIVTDKENKDKNAETQEPKTTNKTNPIDNSKNETKDQDNSGKTADNKNQNNIPPDDYPVDFNKEGVEWGSKQSLIPQEDTSKVGDSATIGATDETQRAAIADTAGNLPLSKKSVSDPNLKPIINPSDSSTSTQATSETPGVTQSASELQTQAEQGNTEDLPPPPDNIPAPEPQEREPELVFDESGNLVFATTDASEKITTDTISGATEEQLLQRIDYLESELSKLDKEIAENNVSGISNDDIFVKYISLMNELYKIQGELDNRG